MSGDKTKLPSVVWAQRNDKLYVTLNVEDVKEPYTIKLDDKKLYFQATGGDKAKYETTIEFFKEIDPNESKYVVLARNIPMMIKKKEEGPYWPRLLSDKSKQHWLKTDFTKWVDEDDSDDEGSKDKDMQLEEMMKQMGGMGMGGGMGGMPGMGGMGGMPGMGGMGGMPGMGGMGGMAGMGGMGGMPGMGMSGMGDLDMDGAPAGLGADEGEDSDDEELPDLE